MRKLSAVAAAAGVVIATLAFPQPANAESCGRWQTDTGGNLNGQTVLFICHTGAYVRTVDGYHFNASHSYGHEGHIRIADNHNHAWDFGNEMVPPRDYSTRSAKSVNRNENGTRFCAVWVKKNGSFTTGYACTTIHA
jgi:hypothetical protein